MSKGKTPMRPGQVDRPDNEIVWVSCRGSRTCEGRQAKVLIKQNLGVGGTVIRYICMTCKRPFSITL